MLQKGITSIHMQPNSACATTYPQSALRFSEVCAECMHQKTHPEVSLLPHPIQLPSMTDICFINQYNVSDTTKKSPDKTREQLEIAHLNHSPTIL